MIDPIPDLVRELVSAVEATPRFGLALPFQSFNLCLLSSLFF
jgi:hypothetical protein